MDNLGAVVVCGGRSSRMGRSKAWLPFGPERLLQRVVRILGQRASSVVVVAAEGQELPSLPENCSVATDERPGLGPLQGIATGLEALRGKAETAYVSATDVPGLRIDWIDTLQKEMGDADLVMPFVDGYHHPLAALYRVEPVLAAARTLLSANRLRPLFLVEACDAKIVDFETLANVDPAMDTLRNLNTPADYFAALEAAGLDDPKILIELFGPFRLRAGVPEFECRARFVFDALNALTRRHPGLEASLTGPNAARKLNLNGERFVEPEEMLVDGDRLLVFSADVGG